LLLFATSAAAKILPFFMESENPGISFFHRLIVFSPSLTNVSRDSLQLAAKTDQVLLALRRLTLVNRGREDFNANSCRKSIAALTLSTEPVITGPSSLLGLVCFTYDFELSHC